MSEIVATLIGKYKINTYQNNTFLRWRMIFLAFMAFQGTILSPVFSKIQGENLTVTTLAVLGLAVMCLPGALQPALDMISDKVICIGMVCADCSIVIASMFFLVFQDYTMTMMLIGVNAVAVIVGDGCRECYKTRVIDITSKKYPNEQRGFQNNINLLKSLVRFVGYFIAIFLSYVADIQALLAFNILVMIPLGWVYYKQYQGVIEEKSSTPELFEKVQVTK